MSAAATLSRNTQQTPRWATSSLRAPHSTAKAERKVPGGAEGGEGGGEGGGRPGQRGGWGGREVDRGRRGRGERKIVGVLFRKNEKQIMKYIIIILNV